MIFFLNDLKLDVQIRRQGSNSFLYKRKIEILFISITLRGFPPTVVFFMKFLLLIKLNFFTISILGMTILIRIFLYTSFIVLRITKAINQSKTLIRGEYFLQEKKKSNERFFFYYF